MNGSPQAAQISIFNGKNVLLNLLVEQAYGYTTVR